MVELKDKTRISYHKGTHTIGGTLIEIAYRDSRIFFDLGSVYDGPIDNPNIDLLLERGLIADVEGLYDNKAYKKIRDLKESPYKNQAAFISHCHLDHSSLVNFINPQIDVYTSKKTRKVLETVSIYGNFIFKFDKKQDKADRIIRDIKIINENESIKIGEIEVSFIPVDHDAYGACGFLIKTPTITIAYTGDIRKHGFHPEKTEEFCKKAYNCDILITEAVSFSFNKLYGDNYLKIPTESQLVDQIAELVSENKTRQITFNYYLTNFERIEAIYQKTKNIRKMVLTEYYAFCVKQILGIETFYYRTKGEDFGLNPDLEIDINSLLEDRKEYFWQIRPRELDLVDKLMDDGLYIHSDCKPLGDYDPYYEIFMDKFIKSKVEVKIISSSGHAPTRDLYQILKKINAKFVTPVHSFNPERVYYDVDRLLNPFDGAKILI